MPLQPINSEEGNLSNHPKTILECKKRLQQRARLGTLTTTETSGLTNAEIF